MNDREKPWNDVEISAVACCRIPGGEDAVPFFSPEFFLIPKRTAFPAAG